MKLLLLYSGSDSELAAVLSHAKIVVSSCKMPTLVVQWQFSIWWHRIVFRKGELRMVAMASKPLWRLRHSSQVMGQVSL